MNIVNNSYAAFLALAEEKLLNDEPVSEVIDLLMENLRAIRQQLSFEAWRQFATVDCRQHSIMKILKQDPFIWRALNKPRGYAGDGETLDFIFAPEDGFIPQALQEASEIGQKLYAHTANTIRTTGSAGAPASHCGAHQSGSGTHYQPTYLNRSQVGIYARPDIFQHCTLDTLGALSP